MNKPHQNQLRDVLHPAMKKGKRLKAHKAYELKQSVVCTVPIEFFACD